MTVRVAESLAVGSATMTGVGIASLNDYLTAISLLVAIAAGLVSIYYRIKVNKE